MDKEGKIRIAIITSLISMFITFVPDICNSVDLSTLCLIIQYGTLIASYVLAGPRNVIKRFTEIAYYGWLLIPVFPIDAAFVLATIFIAIYTLLVLPIIYILGEYFRNKKERKEAEEYLSCCNLPA